MKKLWNWICSFFTRENIGIIWRVLFTQTKESVKNTIHDPAIQQKAFDLALSLLKKDLTGEQKKDMFNDAMKEYLKGIGAEIGTSTLNTIRELALDAVKKSSGEGCADGSCCVKSVILFLAAGLMAFGASAADNIIQLKAGRNYGIEGVIHSWHAYSTNLTATVQADRVLDLYVKETGTAVITNIKEQVTYEPRAVIVTNGVSYTYSNAVSVASVVTNGGFTVWTNGQLSVVGESVTTNYVYSTTNAVYAISTNWVPSMVVAHIPVTNTATVVRMRLAMSVTNNVIAAKSLSGGAAGGTGLNKAMTKDEYLVVSGTIANDPEMKLYIYFNGHESTALDAADADADATP